eukprot:1407447-Pyramimonas_sp.AAC.1
MQEDWTAVDLVCPLGAECLGRGTLAQPLLIFGDASGGPESRFPSLRRVGLGLVVMTDPIAMTIGTKIAGPLTGRVQSVPRGELRCLELAIRWSAGPTVYISDNENVVRGWHAQQYLNPGK